MSPARRSEARRTWPRGLYAPRPGYYVWRSATGKTYALGMIPLAAAKAEANAANAHEAALKPTLVERMSGAAKTVGDLLDKLKPAKAVSTNRTNKGYDKRIRAAFGSVRCDQLTVAQCAELIESLADEGKTRSAGALRSRLVAMCKRGQHLGWMTGNPAAVTATPDFTVLRGRLTMETFWAIYEQAPNVNKWLQRAMMFGLVLGCDRLTLTQLQQSNVHDGWLTFKRQKTGAWISAPLRLRLDVVKVSLQELIDWESSVDSPYLLHHPHNRGAAKAGDPIDPETVSEAFTAARKLAKIADEGAPTLHELRSLAKREYEKQGNVDTLALLGHAGERTGDLYADPRGVESIRVKVDDGNRK